MTLDERTNAIGAILRAHVLPRFKRPEHLDDTTARAEVSDMVADLNREWPVVGRDAFDAIGERFARELRKSARSREWPSIAVMLKALDTAKGAAQAEGGEVDDETLYRRVVAFWQACKGELKSAVRPGHAERMVSERVATWGELAWHGFRIPDDRRADAERENRDRHAAIMADLRAQTVGLALEDAPRGGVRP